MTKEDAEKTAEAINLLLTDREGYISEACLRAGVPRDSYARVEKEEGSGGEYQVVVDNY